MRRRGYDHDAALDLTQEFFARLIGKQWLQSVAREKGRFRSFILVAVDHFLANEWRNSKTARRGGGRHPISLEEVSLGEGRFVSEPAMRDRPEEAFDRNWASTVLDQALAKLRGEFCERKRLAQFEDWKVFLSREASRVDCEDSARRLGVRPGAVAVGIHRFRERFGVLLREAVAHTVHEADDVDAELRYLIGLLAG